MSASSLNSTLCAAVKHKSDIYLPSCVIMCDLRRGQYVYYTSNNSCLRVQLSSTPVQSSSSWIIKKCLRITPAYISGKSFIFKIYLAIFRIFLDIRTIFSPLTHGSIYYKVCMCNIITQHLSDIYFTMCMTYYNKPSYVMLYEKLCEFEIISYGSCVHIKTTSIVRYFFTYI